MSYKVLIVDNDNGDVIYDKPNATAIIGAITGDSETQSIGIASNCDTTDVAYTIFCALDAIDEITTNHPSVLTLLKIYREMEQ